MSDMFKEQTTTLPLVPLRDIVIFPQMIVPLFVGRQKSVKALEKALSTDKRVFLVTQREGAVDNPTKDELYDIGVIGTVLQLLKLPDGTVKVLVEGVQRAKILKVHMQKEMLDADLETLSVSELKGDDKKAAEAMSRACITQFEQYARLNKKVSEDIVASLSQVTDLDRLSDTMAAHTPIKLAQKQIILESMDLKARFEKLYEYIEGEISVLEVEKKVRRRVKDQMEKSQRDYYLNEQMKAIQKELGDDDNFADVKEIEARIKEKKLPEAALKKVEKELRKLKNMNPMSAEATVVRNYIDWTLDIPWHEKSKLKGDLNRAEEVLDEDHYGLEKVKERIVEYIAVQKRTKKIRGPILCLVGPPGVGKTSLGKSIARATGREFVRVALGGVRDESEIRGHRRTYIGALPGKIIQGMKKAEKTNPVFMLDEIDKLGADFRGDPSSALLEVLDPEQNNSFNDHYLEMDYDLSDVMFVCTANSMNIPRPLMDRMEVINVSGYTEDEKIEIANRHLLTKQMDMNGLKKDEISISEDTIRHLIRYYTREAGVRSLERTIASLCRKSVKKLVKEKDLKQITVEPDHLEDMIGVRKFKFGEAEKADLVGVTTGLAWTEVGGDILSIEAVMFPGKGEATMTGQLGDVMKESVKAAEMLIRSRSLEFGIPSTLLKMKNIHLHVPEGATPKDGPSAGIAMVTSIVSVLTGIPVRKDIAMTGEITLRGRVFQIGGLKEKLLAALRAGIKKVLIPIDNEKDLKEIPDNVKESLEIVPVRTIDEVLLHALAHEPTPISEAEDREFTEKMAKIMQKTVENRENLTIHH